MRGGASGFGGMGLLERVTFYHAAAGLTSGCVVTLSCQTAPAIMSATAAHQHF
jgi:hypothetical protein